MNIWNAEIRLISIPSNDRSIGISCQQVSRRLQTNYTKHLEQLSNRVHSSCHKFRLVDVSKNAGFLRDFVLFETDEDHVIFAVQNEPLCFARMRRDAENLVLRHFRFLNLQKK